MERKEGPIPPHSRTTLSYYHATCFGSLEAVNCHKHSVRYDMAVNRGTCGASVGLIKSPTTL
eukprot:scaffold65_cov186-Skeletonema_dohrnii-CCMP3373.AAC.1